MTHDILIISDPEDKSASDMVARRLRALKFRVRNNRAPNKAEPTAKDIAEVENARAVLALWTKPSTNEARPQAIWMMAMVRGAHAADRTLVHARRGPITPHSDIAAIPIYDLKGLTGRKLVPGFVDVVELLGAAVSRTGLKDWLDLDADNLDGQAAWLANHPNDPLTGKEIVRSEPPAEVAAAEPVAVKPPRVVIPPPVNATLKPKRFDPSKQPPAGGELLLAGVGLGIIILFVVAFVVRSQPLETPGPETVMPPFAAPCRDNPDDPACRQTLQPSGEIIDDTE
ncbi:MAG: hypothetical protein AAFO63_02310 [Pseudomonadota bacterium]